MKAWEPTKAGLMRVRMTGEQKFVEREHLVNDAYSDSVKLSARRAIYQYQTPKIRLPNWVLGHLEHPPGRVLDVGCGPGVYLEKLRDSAGQVVGVDLSHGMVAEAQRISPDVCVADAENLPFKDSTFDTTLSIHMLYHVPGISHAVSELRRVTKTGGTVLVVTNGADHQRSLRETFDQIVQELAGPNAEPVLSTSRRFRLEEGREILHQAFDDVQRDDFNAEIEVPSVGPLIDYMESIRSFHEHKLPKSVTWERVMILFEEKVKKEIARSGTLPTSNRSGVFVCR